jgi:integral membrane protein
MMNSRIVSAFRIIAVVEALTWLGLLVGMYFKWIAETSEVGVKVFGPIHGGVFVLYIAIALVTARVQRWSVWTTFFALAASIPPFFTLWFEVWAKRSGRLDPVARQPVALPA